MSGPQVTLEPTVIAANGLEFSAIAAGPVSGELVILLHGFPEGSYSWRHQIAAVAKEGFRVVAPDLRGYGFSKPTDVGRSPRVVAASGIRVPMCVLWGDQDAALSPTGAVVRSGVNQEFVFLRDDVEPCASAACASEDMSASTVRDLGRYLGR